MYRIIYDNIGENNSVIVHDRRLSSKYSIVPYTLLWTQPLKHFFGCGVLYNEFIELVVQSLCLRRFCFTVPLDIIYYYFSFLKIL